MNPKNKKETRGAKRPLSGRKKAEIKQKQNDNYNL